MQKAERKKIIWIVFRRFNGKNTYFILNIFVLFLVCSLPTRESDCILFSLYFVQHEDFMGNQLWCCCCFIHFTRSSELVAKWFCVCLHTVIRSLLLPLRTVSIDKKIANISNGDAYGSLALPLLHYGPVLNMKRVKFKRISLTSHLNRWVCTFFCLKCKVDLFNIFFIALVFGNDLLYLVD